MKARDEGTVRNKAVHVALGVRPDGTKEVMGLWIEQTEGAKFWLRVMTELRERGVEDILIAVVGGLKGFPDLPALEGPHVIAGQAAGRGQPGDAHPALQQAEARRRRPL